MKGTIKIAIADDHPMVIDCLVNYFNLENGFEVVSTTSQLSQIIPMIKHYSPEVLLMDYHFTNEEQTGLDICRELTRTYPLTRVIIISSFSDLALIKKFTEAGASGYLLKTAEKNEYIDAIKNVVAGGESFGKDVRELIIQDRINQQPNRQIQFTKTEKEVLKLIMEGYSTRDIARKLFREKSTIDFHRKSILSKFYLMDSNNTNPSKNISYYILKFNLTNHLDSF